MIDEPCSDCGGRGEVDFEETLEVNIPRGIDEGRALRIPGRGHPSPEAGGTPGDLHVVVRAAPDPRFDRRGPHLWHVQTIEIPDAVLGTKQQLSSPNN